MTRCGVAPDPRRLLRWYPRAWRERHGAVLLGTLEEHAEVRGRPVLTRADAWSVRVHGVAERLSPGAGAGLALVGAAVLLLGIVGGIAGAGGAGVVLAWLAAVAVAGVGPALLSLSAAAWLRDRGVTTAPGTVLAAAASLLTWLLATLASFSWSSSFDQADLDLEPTGLAVAFPALFLGALLTGAVALYPVIAGVFRSVRSTAARRVLAAGGAVIGAVLVGVLMLAPGSALLAALGLLTMWGLRWRTRDADTAGTRPSTRPGTRASTRPSTRASTSSCARPAGSERPWSRPVPRGERRVDPARRGRLVAVAVLTVLLSAPFSLYALLGGSGPPGLTWSPGAWSQLPPMNVGLTGGALASLPLLAAAGPPAVRRWGHRGGAAVLLACVAVVMRAVSAAMGPTGETGTYVLFAAAVLVGIAAVLLVADKVPGPAALRWAVVVVAGAVAGWAVGLPVLAVFPLLVPVAALVLAVLLARRPRLAHSTQRGTSLA